MKTNMSLIFIFVISASLCALDFDEGNMGPRLPITSGRINTRNKFSFVYGKLEARIKLPKTANGLWPAFWLLGNSYEETGWPVCGEIDIMEMGARAGIEAGSQERYLSGAAHWGKNPQRPLSYSLSGPAPYNLQDEKYHLYTMMWDERSIKMYLDLDIHPDAAPYFAMDINVYNGDDPVGNYFHKPFHIILNLAAGGTYPDIYEINKVTALNEANNYTAKMYVDYVRLSQKDANGVFQITWIDDFTSDPPYGNSPNAQIWNIETDDSGGGNNELQSYRPGAGNVELNVDPDSGEHCLVITAGLEMPLKRISLENRASQGITFIPLDTLLGADRRSGPGGFRLRTGLPRRCCP
jgi:beta-glucanase (GH16 family)